MARKAWASAVARTATYAALTDSAAAIFTDAEHFAQLENCAVYPIHLLYAALLAEDEHRDATLAKLRIHKKRLLNVVKRDALAVQAGLASASQKERTRWN